MLNKSASKKVLIITYYWPPSGGAGVQRWLKFVKYLPEFAIIPFVLTVDELKANYPVFDPSLFKDVPPSVKVHRTNTFEPFGIYKNISANSQLPYGGFTNESDPGFLQKASRFMRGNFFIPDPRRGWNFFAYRKACELIEKEKIDTVITTSPPHSTQLIGKQLKQKYGITWIADLRDPWTDIYYYKKLYPTRIANWINSRYERLVLEQADKIIVVSEAICKKLAEKSDKVSDKKFEIIPNGFDEEDFKIKSNPPTDNLIITYTGTVTEDYRFESLIKAITDLKNNNHLKNIKFRFVGSITSSYVNLFSSLLENKFEFIPHVTHEKSVYYLMNSSALLLAIPCVPENKGILTGKLFEYLAARKPIICIGPENGEAAQIITESKAGETYGYNDSSGIYNFLLSLKEKWEKNPDLDLKGDFHLKFSRKEQTQKLVNLIRRV